jgi:hypothetical protein
VVTRHEFLAGLHERLRPRTYLEVGVQHGWSIDLAIHSELAIGIDPEPQVTAKRNQTIFTMTSDLFFDNTDVTPLSARGIDMAFIDGMHLFEYALRDFQNIERYCHPQTVVLFDDVLPRNQHEARRMAPGEPVYGDWTGDVWKVDKILRHYHPDLTYRLIDTQPTGLLAVTGFADIYLPWSLAGDVVEGWSMTSHVPPDVIARTWAHSPGDAMPQIIEETTK